jgi:hypothetical protein
LLSIRNNLILLYQGDGIDREETPILCRESPSGYPRLQLSAIRVVFLEQMTLKIFRSIAWKSQRDKMTVWS